jgi:hypothetical protein
VRQLGAALVRGTAEKTVRTRPVSPPFDNTDRFGNTGRPVETEECAWCRWAYPVSQITSRGGQRLCPGCHALYYGGDEDEDEDEDD